MEKYCKDCLKTKKVNFIEHPEQWNGQYGNCAGCGTKYQPDTEGRSELETIEFLDRALDHKLVENHQLRTEKEGGLAMSKSNKIGKKQVEKLAIWLYCLTDGNYITDWVNEDLPLINKYRDKALDALKTMGIDAEKY